MDLSRGGMGEHGRQTDRFFVRIPRVGSSITWLGPCMRLEPLDEQPLELHVEGSTEMSKCRSPVVHQARHMST